MDDVSGLADKSNDFASFLTVSPKLYVNLFRLKVAILLLVILKSISCCISMFTACLLRVYCAFTASFEIDHPKSVLLKSTTTKTTTPNNARKKCADYGNRAESEICEFEQKPIQVDVEDKFVLLEKAQAKKRKENLLFL